MPPKEFYNKGIRILGRSAIECAIDAHSVQMAKSIKQMKDTFFPHEEAIFLDLFAGSGNSLYHAAQSLNSPISIGIEINKGIFQLTKINHKIMGSDCQIHQGGSLEVIRTFKFPVSTPIIVFLAPPWGKGFSFDTGLDLLKTNPPTDEIIKIVKETFSQYRLIFVTQIYEKLVRSSLNKITDQFSYFSKETIPAISQGLNIGLLICTNEKPFLQ